MSEKSLDIANRAFIATCEYAQGILEDTSMSKDEKMLALLAEMVSTTAGVSLSIALLHDSVEAIRDRISER